MAGSQKLAARPPVPREHLVLVGGPSNMFNGFIYWDGSEWQANRPPANLDDVSRYVTRADSGAAVNTHDLYWGNFITPVSRLVSTGKLKPRAGDLLTIMVVLGPYRRRAAVDWDASPHNPRWAPLHRPPSASGLIGSPAPSLKKKPNAKPAAPVTDEDRINHEIFMRVTGPDDELKGYIRRPHRPSHYLDIIHDLPMRIVFDVGMHGPSAHLSSAPKLPGVLVKLLMVTSITQLNQYILHGTWPDGRAKHWRHPLLARNEEEMAELPSLEDGANWDFAATRPKSWAIPYWDKMPEVDRTRVKIANLHYIGHSSHEGLYFSYGWTNEKGEAPHGEAMYGNSELAALLGPRRHHGSDAITTRDAKAMLWGCHLGLTSSDVTPPVKTVADALIPHFSQVTGANDATLFTRILDSDSALPVPSTGDWVTHARR